VGLFAESKEARKTYHEVQIAATLLGAMIAQVQAGEIDTILRNRGTMVAPSLRVDAARRRT
jgi:hypothetical protein